MVDPKSVEELLVLKDRQHVASLKRIQDGAVFRYRDDYLSTSLPPIAYHLPKTADGILTRGTSNLHSFFAGLLPEGVMFDVFARAKRISPDDLFSILAMTGTDAIGDVTVRVPGEPAPISPKSVQETSRLVRELLQGRGVSEQNAISGAQPKLSIGQAVAGLRGKVAIVKVEPEQYPGLLINEWFFMRLAAKAGLRVAKVEIVEDALVVERFDRTKRPNRPPAQIHVEDALQLMDRYPLAKYSLDYTEILDLAVSLGAGTAVLLDLLRLYAYSYVIVNCDLHAKNVSFQHDPATNRWRLTPAYDLVCTLPYFPDDPFSRHMALPLDEQYAQFRAEDFHRIGERYGVPSKAVEGMLSDVIGGVTNCNFDGVGLPVEVTEEIRERVSGLRPW